MSFTNFSQEDRRVKTGYYDDPDQAGSYHPAKEGRIKVQEWVKFISYYRYYIDEFAEDILGIRLFPFQKLILRAMGRNQNSMLICSRGIGKSWISAVFMVCMCILYAGYKFGIASGKGQQSRNVIVQKIKGELLKNENLKREIFFPVRTAMDECYVSFKNGSEIRAVVLGQNQSGDSARSWRFNAILVDEARLVTDNAIETVLVPMTKTNRQNLIAMKQKYPEKKFIEKGKMVYISSAYLKTCDLYDRFKDHYYKMVKHSPDYFVCSLDYRVGVDAGIFEEDDILQERDKTSMTIDRFDYEYNGVFVGSSSESYFPFDLTEPTRMIEKCELKQPSKTVAEYIITHDVAVSGATKSDNAVTHVIKLKQRPGGLYYKEVVYTKTMHGVPIHKQKEFLRELIHIRFPNTKKLVIDVLGSGAGLPSMFYETWEYRHENGQTLEFPPLVIIGDEEGATLDNAIPMIKAITATTAFNTQYYSYLKSCFEDKSLRLLKGSSEMDSFYKDGAFTAEEFSQYVETDILIQEAANIKQSFTDSGVAIFTRIVKTKKRDRVTSLLYGLSEIAEMENVNRQNFYRKPKSNQFENYLKYINL
jgi:hypothetical protein